MKNNKIKDSAYYDELERKISGNVLPASQLKDSAYYRNLEAKLGVTYDEQYKLRGSGKTIQTSNYYDELHKIIEKIHYQEAVVILLFSIIQMIVTYKLLKSSIKEVSLKTLINMSLRATAFSTLLFIVNSLNCHTRYSDVLMALLILTPISYIIIYPLLRLYDIEKPFKHTCGYIFNSLILLTIIGVILKITK